MYSINHCINRFISGFDLPPCPQGHLLLPPLLKSVYIDLKDAYFKRGEPWERYRVDIIYLFIYLLQCYLDMKSVWIHGLNVLKQFWIIIIFFTEQHGSAAQNIAFAHHGTSSTSSIYLSLSPFDQVGIFAQHRASLSFSFQGSISTVSTPPT